MPSFEELKEILGFNTYYEEEKRYATTSSRLPSRKGEQCCQYKLSKYLK